MPKRWLAAADFGAACTTMVLCCMTVFAAMLSAQAPPTPQRMVIDTLYGVPVSDPYRWLESDSAEVRTWFRAQGAYARAVLDALPGRAAILERIRAMAAAAAPEVSLPVEAGGRWFYTIRRAGEPFTRLYVRDAWTGEERMIVDPAAEPESGAAGQNRLATFRPSPDGRLVAYGLAPGGTDDVVLRVRDAASGRDVDGPLVRTHWYDSPQWSPDGRVLFYRQFHRLPASARPSDYLRDQRVLRHRVGAPPTGDVPVFSAAAVGKDSLLLAMLTIDAAAGLAIGRLNSGVESYGWQFFTAPLTDATDGTPSWRPLFTPTDSLRAIAVHGSEVYVLTSRQAPRGRILRASLAKPELQGAVTVMPEAGYSITELSAAVDALYVQVFEEGVNRIVRIPWGGAPRPLALPAGTSVGSLQADPLRSGISLTLTSTTSAPRVFRYDPALDAIRELPLRTLGPGDHLEGFVTETLFVPGHDGVKIPLTLTHAAHTVRDGSNPVLLYAYGSYGMTDPPEYFRDFRPWAESGGIDATCHVRGGGYYGETWHRAGQKSTKANTWLDFIACADYVVREGYTQSSRLAALGLSAGGITVGRAITERPELFAAAVIDVGLLDAVRFENMPRGAAHVPEFGSVSSEAGFRALLAMSALHHVRPGTRYPAVLISTGMNDVRVAPWQSAKMAAALQAATTSGRPVLLRVDERAGHMYVENTEAQQQEQVADWLAFLMRYTAMPAYR